MAKILDRPRTWVGHPHARLDLEPLVRGAGRYVDDESPEGTLHLAVVRSVEAHARITRLDLSPALATPGVVAVFGPQDAAAVPPLPILSVVPDQTMDAFPLVYDRALYVGQPLAFVAAASRYEAEDGAEAVTVAYEPLPPVVDVFAATADGAPLLHPSWGTNVAAVARHAAGDADGAIASAAYVLETTVRTPRQMGIPMEGRAILARYDAHDRTLHVRYSTQTPGVFRTYLAAATGLPEDRIRVVVPHVGGGFGNKLHYFPEEVVACLLAIRTGRPVKYVEDRFEHFAATVHSREQVIRARAGFGRDGVLTGLVAEILVDAGAHLHTKGNAPAWLTARMLTGPYRVAHTRVECKAIVTNKTPYGAYRGFGQPQAVFVHERLMEQIAARTGLDPAEVRRRNLIGPDEMPYRNPAQLVYDSGDLPRVLDSVLAASGYETLRARQRERRAAGRRYGVGLAMVIEYTAMGPTKLMARAGNRQGGYESALVRIEPSGAIAAYTGLIEIGQGTMTALAQICADAFGVRPDEVNVYSGDTHTTPYSFYGTAASRGAPLAGGAMVLATRRLREKLLRIAAHLLDAPAADVVLADGAARLRADPRRSIPLPAIALEAWRAQKLPAGEEPGLEAKAIYDPENWTFSNQAHVVGCEVDPETGEVRLDDYHLAHDCGTVLNPRLVEDQIRGGVVQGLGGALLEAVRYDDRGQLLTRTFLDYVVPSAPDAPRLSIQHHETPSPHIPGGMKGVAEGGLIGANVAIANAVLDALGTAGVDHASYPVTPATVRALLAAYDERGV